MTHAAKERMLNRLKEKYMHLSQEQLAEILALITVNLTQKEYK